MPKQTTTLKMSDIQKVSQKLDGLMQKLPDQEKEVLGWILARAQAAGNAQAPVKPVSPARRSPALAASAATAARKPALSANLAKAAGLGTAGTKASEITVSWKHKFDSQALGAATKVNPAIKKVNPSIKLRPKTGRTPK